MLYRFEEELRGAAIHATDDSIGRVSDFHFDGRHWVVRYLVVDTGDWLPGRLVVISPVSVDRFDRSGRVVHVSLSREQIENSPSISVSDPLLAEQEAALAGYYSWPLYGPVLQSPVSPPAATTTADKAAPSRLLSASSVTGDYLHALDGDLGHVDDFVLEDFVWTVRYLAINTRNWWPGKKVLVARNWIGKVDWVNSRVHVNLTREQIRSSPEYHPDAPITREYETRLWAHYGQPPYWL